MKEVKYLILLALILSLVSHDAEARRRRRKFKGVVIVNQILKLVGTVQRNGEDAPEFSGVKQGDVLETPDKSEATIRIPGLLILRMGPNTKLKLTQFNDRNEGKFELYFGEVLALFRRVGDHDFQIPHGDIKLHGTTFLVSSPKDSKLDKVLLEEGKIKVTAKVAASKAAPTASPTPVASPLYGTSLSAAPVPSPAKASTPVPQPSTPAELDMTATTDNSSQCEVGQEGVVLAKDKLSDRQAEIKDLQSLYDLP